MFKKYLILSFITLPLALCAEKISPESSSTEFTAGSSARENESVYTFSGEYPELDRVSIHHPGDKWIELNLGGQFPLLEMVESSISSGKLKATLTGKFNKLSNVELSSTSGSLDVNVYGEFKRDVSMMITSTSGKIFIRVPKELNVEVEVHTKNGKITNYGRLDEQGFGFFGLVKDRFFVTDLKKSDREQMPKIHIFVETTSGDVAIY